ncbi:MAG: molybdopterin dinucleotide binding domain-containing protein, partial [Pseudomonadota bacterium]
KALWVMSTNPAVSLPNANAVAAAIANVPFVAVSDIMAQTDTGDLADVLLPATGWGEKDGTVTNSERRISRQRAFLPTPGQARPDWKIICEVATRMGWGDHFAYDSPADVFAEYIALSGATRDFGCDLDLSVFADADYANLIPTQWPRDDHRFFADGAFFHTDGKAKMLPIFAPDLAPTHGFRLNTGRIRDQWHTMTRTGKSPRLGAHLAEPYVELHPSDVARLGIETAGLARVTSHNGQVAILRTLPADKVSPGHAFAPMHWTRQRSAAGWINAVVDVTTDPNSGQPALKSGMVQIERFDAAWYGYLVSATPIIPDADYAAVARIQTGWQAELAGVQAVADWPAFLARLIDMAGCDISTVQGQGHTRIALTRQGTLVALFFASPQPVVVSRAHVTAQIGTHAPGLVALAGRPGSGAPDPGATVCSCMSVGINTLRDAISDGAHSVDALGVCTGAGTSCGSCRPELAQLIITHTRPLAAE